MSSWRLRGDREDPRRIALVLSIRKDGIRCLISPYIYIYIYIKKSPLRGSLRYLTPAFSAKSPSKNPDSPSLLRAGGEEVHGARGLPPPGVDSWHFFLLLVRLGFRV